ncbi:MAG: hypothetical protein IPG97_02135 [Microthrixaceae bacterium]|jgi:hypothetical protein|nr:hypothetical protein [Microthrixaceae bacterium]
MQPTIYGLDIETDTRNDGADPTIAPVITVALSGRNFDEIFVGSEAYILTALDDRLSTLAPGVLATWNGSTFDLPFMADRALLLGVDLGLRLCVDQRLTMQRALLPGHRGAYRAAWHHHSHIDTFRLYGESAPAGPWSSLRVIGRALGLTASANRGEARGRCQLLATEALHAHAASDARLARVLAERRWSTAQRLVDRLDTTEAELVTVAASRLERQARLERQPAPAMA